MNADHLAEFGLDSLQREKLGRLAQLSIELEISGTAIDSLPQAIDVHIADSLVGLSVPAIKEATSLFDIGAGVGFPGLVLAIARPDLEVTLLDSVRKKMETAGRMARDLEIDNVACLWGRAEELALPGEDSRERFDVVSARALAQLNVLLEYAAPLLRVGGSLVAWKGDPEPSELTAAEVARKQLGFGPPDLIETRPFARSRTRHFFVAEKTAPTGEQYPRRPGVALRKPLGA